MSDCPHCGADRAPEPTTCETSAGRVHLLAERLPVRRCPDHGEPTVSPADREAMRRALDEQLWTARGRWFRSDVCTACGHELSMPVRRTRRSVTAVFPDGPAPATLTFDLPRTRCPECALDQVPAEAAADVRTTLEAVMDDPPSPGPDAAAAPG